VAGIYELEDLQRTLREQGAELVVAGSLTDSRDKLREGGLAETELSLRHFPTLGRAVRAFKATAAGTLPSDD